MKVIVTGGCGFLGSHVCEFYIEKGDEVIAYDNMTKYELERTGFATDAARNHNSEYLKRIGVKTIKADVRNFEELLDYTQGCDYIIHTAAQPAMTISWENPKLDLETNVIGTFNTLEIARRLKIPIAICATVHVYGNTINESLIEEKRRYTRKPAGIDETGPILQGTLTPLHVSKAAGDAYLKTYVDTYKIKGASFRLTGIYGTRQFGGEDHGWVANFAIRSILKWPITIFGNGKQVRDIIYASDVCEAFDAFYKTRNSGIYNIGGGTETAISLIECIDILELLNGERPQVKFKPDRHGDLHYFVCDIAKARSSLNWSPKIKPKEGIAALIRWIKKNEKLLIAQIS